MVDDLEGPQKFLEVSGAQFEGAPKDAVEGLWVTALASRVLASADVLEWSDGDLWRRGSIFLFLFASEIIGENELFGIYNIVGSQKAQCPDVLYMYSRNGGDHHRSNAPHYL